MQSDTTVKTGDQTKEFGNQGIQSQNLGSQNLGNQNLGNTGYGSQNLGQNLGNVGYGGQNFDQQNLGSQNIGNQYGGQNIGQGFQGQDIQNQPHIVPVQQPLMQQQQFVPLGYGNNVNQPLYLDDAMRVRETPLGVEIFSHTMRFDIPLMSKGRQVRRYLVCIDGTERSRTALQYVLDMSDSNDLVFLCYFPVQPRPRMMVGGGRTKDSSRQLEQLRLAEAKQVLLMTRNALQQGGLQCANCEIVTGVSKLPWKNIVRTANELNVDTIIMGRSPRLGMTKRYWAKTTTQRVSKGAGCTVIVA